MLTLPLLFLLCYYGEGARIIFNGMHASDSHVGSMLPVATRLLNDGHKVHFMESHTKPSAFKYPPNITYTYMQLPHDEILHKQILPAMWTNFYGPGDFPKVWLSGDSALIGMYDTHKDKLLGVVNDTWDLAVADELFSVSSYALGLLNKRKGSPFVVMATCATSHPMRYSYSLGGNLIHRPSMFIQVGVPHDPESFISRFNAFIHAVRIVVGIGYVTTYKAIEGMSRIGVTDFHMSQLAQQSSYYFVDELNPLVWPAPTATEVVNVGYNCPKVGDLPLPKDYKDFLEDPKSKGTILIAFGSNAVWQYAPEYLTKAFVDGINMMKDYRFVFSFNGNMEQLKGIGSHCRVTNWAPQKEILYHPKTKVFVSHGGLKSMKDTICGTIPVIVMPLFAEQPHNAELVRQAGIAEIFVKTDLTAELFSSTVKKISENRSYKDNIVKLKTLLLDRPAPSLDLAAFAARRAIKMGDRFPTFKRKGMFLTMFEHFHMPVVISAILLVSLIC